MTNYFIQSDLVRGIRRIWLPFLIVYFPLPLLSCKNNVLVPGSLAHSPSHKEAQSLLSFMVMESKQVRWHTPSWFK
jgi:hypothetical protein